jgi:hypothetical protein
MENTMKNYKDNLLGALYMLRTVIENYDTDIAHNILINGDSEQTEKEKEQDLNDYLDVLDNLIKQSWLLEGNSELIDMSGKKLSK